MTASYSFEACLALVFQFDGYKDDKAPGESFATVYGVTAATWAGAVSDGLVANKPVEQATLDDCVGIIRTKYWNAIRASQMPPGVGLMVFNDSVLCGGGHEVRLLQRILGCRDVDGVVGPETLRKAGSYGDKALIDALHDADEEYLASLANAPLYLKGWERREDAMRDAAYRMSGLRAAVA